MPQLDPRRVEKGVLASLLGLTQKGIAKLLDLDTSLVTSGASLARLVPHARFYAPATSAAMKDAWIEVLFSAGPTASSHCALELPLGMTLTKIDWRVWNRNLTDSQQLKVRRIDDTNGITDLATDTYTGAVGFSTRSIALAEVTTAERYVLKLTQTATAAGDDTRFLWARVYTTPANLRALAGR